MRRSLRAAAAWTAVAAVCLPVSACRPVPAADPFRAPREGPVGPDVRTVRLRFQVSCDTCVVRWTVGSESGGGGQEKALWSARKDLRLRPGQTAEVGLTASPYGAAGPVEWVRIFVDGEVRAEARRTDEPTPTGQGTHGSLSVSLTVPPP